MPLRDDARYLARCSNLGNQPISIFCRMPFSHARVMPARKASRQMGFTQRLHSLREIVRVERPNRAFVLSEIAQRNAVAKTA
jgi:hypothetical protein